MKNNTPIKVYYGKKSNALRNYIIIITICIILPIVIRGEDGIYISSIFILTAPLFILQLRDQIELKNLKITLHDKKLIINKGYEGQKEIKYTDIKLIYVIIGNLFNESRIQIIKKGGKMFTEINVQYIEDTKSLLEDLYRKNIIICDITIRDSYTNNIQDPNAIFVGPVVIGKNPSVQDPYAITRTIQKKYRGISEDETEKFEKENNLIDGNIEEENLDKKSKKSKI